MELQSRKDFSEWEKDKDKYNKKDPKSPVYPVDYTAIEAGENIQSADSMPNANVSESETEMEGSFYKTELEKINDFVQYILPQIENEKDLPMWVQDKITKCKTHLEDINNYIKNKETPKGTDTVEG